MEKQTQTIEDLKQQLNVSKGITTEPASNVQGSPSFGKSRMQKVTLSHDTTVNEGYQLPTCNSRVEFPHFNGEGFKSWLSKAEQFFFCG